MFFRTGTAKSPATTKPISIWNRIWGGHETYVEPDEPTDPSPPSHRNADESSSANSTSSYSESASTPNASPATASSTQDSIKKSIQQNKNGAIYANIRGLYPKSDKSKVPHLADLARESNSPFICLTETHLSPDILDAEITIDGYNLFRSDRLNRSHGGVCIYVRKDLAVKLEVKDSNSFCDSLILHIPQLNLVITNLYRPPNCPEELFVQTLEQSAVFLRNMEASSQRANDYLILGDFNFPFLNFKNDSSRINESILKNTCKHCHDIQQCQHTSSERRQAQALLNFAEEFFLQQYIKKPTRKQNILDLVFTNNHFLINDYHIIINSHLSDHYTVCINLNYEQINVDKAKLKANHYHSEIPEFNFRDADDEDWMRLNLELDKVNWESLLQKESADEMSRSFISILTE